MSAVRFNCCAECGRKLQATFFCQACGQPCCCLDCYCRHEATHAEMGETPQAHPAASHLAARLAPAG